MKYARLELLDKIAEAGFKFDGHVTNGSASALADVFYGAQTHQIGCPKHDHYPGNNPCNWHEDRRVV